MTTQGQNGQQYLRTNTIIFYALMTGMTLFTIVVALTRNSEQPINNENLLVFISILAVIVLAAFFIRFQWLPNRLSTIAGYSTLIEKLTNYSKTLIIQWAPIEASCMFSSVAYLITGSMLFMGYNIGIIALFLLIFRPSKERLIQDLYLDSTEIELLDDPNAIVAEFKGRR
ncbi:hypothetical protein NF867_08985 [Solitalea sp. MAHUQ-68]|uniref:Uncharacterized protein n=1 Tax=Solitalea agri TaxID=2953739 RepID=A0A9X2F2J2_9SPHI|nr:hypothetical protein [Solitalea agri]MCO4292995.1 hypothetical protein [Solitalea agri]